MAPRAALRVAEGSAPSATRPRALRARWRASSGVSTPTRPKASFRVLPAEFRYCTTHVAVPDGFTLKAKPERSLSRYSVSRVRGFSASTKRLLSLGKAASAGPPRDYPLAGDTPGTQVGDNPGNSGPLLVFPNNGDIAEIIKLRRTGETSGIPR